MIVSRFIYMLMLQPASRSQNAAAGVDSQGVPGSEGRSRRDCGNREAAGRALMLK
jgi:hypothetical protein